ncbi:hypothetical protein [Pseudomonas moraviensis]|uniref:Uncharacterized protein n=1 Tax=Pseudomonas moraviensis TaxID=321662 RepID=A0A7Z0ASL4_9PSED|nr:hypothetical protein [Pseudomonas moraviensis]NYH07237.1 hypothetical protein [Pseudomonas moraviensis]
MIKDFFRFVLSFFGTRRKPGIQVGNEVLQVDDANSVRPRKCRGVYSSRFLSHKAQMNAYNEAMTRESRKMPRFTGEDSMGNLVVRMKTENIGEGYEPNPTDPSDPRYIPEMRGFEMRFDFETLEPWALYPIEKA